MRETLAPPLRAALLTALLAGLLLFLLNPPSLGGLTGMLTIIGGAILIATLAAWITVRMIGEEMPEPEFRALVDRSEALAQLNMTSFEPTAFDELVIEALDDLPPDFHKLIETTPVVVSQLGHEFGAYGHYIGGTIARDDYPDRIVIYEDTLTRDFGHDPDLLRAQVERTVRHEIAHHLGWDEPGVRGLGL
jgi:predicted Zn-dependent protease with MMP-like domain